MSLMLATEKIDPWAAWWKSWWNVETLGPDLLVGLVTGAVVGVVVMQAERRMARRSAGRSVADAQSGIVERAKSTLRHDVQFHSGQREVLHPDRSLVEGLSAEIRAMPAGVPSERVPGFRWVRGLCDAVAETESLADALDTQIDAIDRRFGNTGTLGAWVRKNIVRYADADRDELDDWGWDWHPQLPDAGTRSVAADPDLWLLVLEYAHQRRLIAANRAAFLETADYLRKEDRKAQQILDDARGGRFRRWRARRDAASTIAASRVWADSQSSALVVGIDPRDG